MEESEKQSSPQYLEAFNRVVSVLQEFEPEVQRRVFDAVGALFGFSPKSRFFEQTLRSATSPTTAPFSEARDMSPKEFVMEKSPTSDVQRVAVLAYYLTHYRSTPHFKTLDISKLNTEAAQPKFSNAAKAVDNAATRGYLVAATKGNKQLSAIGERFVQALPDQQAARELVAKAKPRRRMMKRFARAGGEIADNGDEQSRDE